MKLKFNSILKNIFANSIFSVIQLSFQLISVPLFINYLGAELYGEWLLVMAFSIFLQNSDFGINKYTSNLITIEYVKSNFKEYNTIFNNNIFFHLCIHFVLLVIVFIVMKYSMIDFGFKVISKGVLSNLIIIVVLNSLIGNIKNSLNAIFRAIDKLHIGLNIDNLFKVIEIALLILGLIFGVSVFALVSIILLINVLNLFCKILLSTKHFVIGYKYIDIKKLKNNLSGSIPFFVMPLSISAIDQGVIWIINIFLGSTYVVVFTTIRTFVSTIKIAVGIVHKSIWPEITRLYGLNNGLKLKKLFYQSFTFVTYAVLIFIIGISLFGWDVYVLWVGDDLEVNKTLFYTMMISASIYCIGSHASIFMLAINQVKRITSFFIVFSLLSYFILYGLIWYSLEVYYIGVFFIVYELVFALFLFREFLIEYKENKKDFYMSYKAYARRIDISFMFKN
ncbi:lipopolysaccharide biosynthesis protein [Aquimarina algiphila]|uniref:lipopolysaccharide biosynthesis protein n=1 Tax=Aquimarina algiphila TaxID=2047982 RepID=UPI00232DAABA|nr:hypothetical protein [Aquimarina algiphila]